MVDIMDTVMDTVVFTALIGTIAISVLTVANLSGAALVLVGLIPLFIVIGFVRQIMKSMGKSKSRR